MWSEAAHGICLSSDILVQKQLFWLVWLPRVCGETGASQMDEEKIPYKYASFWRACIEALIAQLGERQTEDLTSAIWRSCVRFTVKANLLQPCKVWGYHYNFTLFGTTMHQRVDVVRSCWWARLFCLSNHHVFVFGTNASSGVPYYGISSSTRSSAKTSWTQAFCCISTTFLC